jgi:hypothetical protein
LKYWTYGTAAAVTLLTFLLLLVIGF